MAACRGMAPEDGSSEPDKFFPERGRSHHSNEAMMVCFGCPVRRECLNYKYQTDTREGIWGGEMPKKDN